MSTRQRRFQRLLTKVQKTLRLPGHDKDDEDSDDLVVYPQATLPSLPTELLLMVVDYLEVSEIACLSLCNRLLRSKLEDMSSDPLTINYETNAQRRNFLVLLAKDYPGYFYCYSCCMLQKTVLVETPRTGFIVGGLECTRDVDFQQRPRWSGFNYNFGFVHLQAAMAHHRYGHAFGIPVEELATTSVSKWFRTPSLQDNHAFNAEGRIVNNELCLRLQDVLVFDYASSRRYDWDLGVNICAHLELPRYHSAHSALWCKTRRLEELVERNCPCCDVLHQCSKCHTEFEIDIRSMGEGMIALVITKWVDLGMGETPLDPMWRRHLPSKSYYSYNGKIVDADVHHSAREAYEKLASMQAKELTEANLSLLRRRLVREIYPFRDKWVHVGPHKCTREKADQGEGSHLRCLSRSEEGI